MHLGAISVYLLQILPQAHWALLNEKSISEIVQGKIPTSGNVLATLKQKKETEKKRYTGILVSTVRRVSDSFTILSPQMH